MNILTEKEKSLLSLGYCIGKEAGHHETVEGYFSGDGRSESHIDDAIEFISDLTIDDINHGITIYKNAK